MLSCRRSQRDICTSRQPWSHRPTSPAPIRLQGRLCFCSQGFVFGEHRVVPLLFFHPHLVKGTVTVWSCSSPPLPSACAEQTLSWHTRLSSSTFAVVIASSSSSKSSRCSCISRRTCPCMKPFVGSTGTFDSSSLMASTTPRCWSSLTFSRCVKLTFLTVSSPEVGLLSRCFSPESGPSCAETFETLIFSPLLKRLPDPPHADTSAGSMFIFEISGTMLSISSGGSGSSRFSSSKCKSSSSGMSPASSGSLGSYGSESSGGGSSGGGSGASPMVGGNLMTPSGGVLE